MPRQLKRNATTIARICGALWLGLAGTALGSEVAVPDEAGSRSEPVRKSRWIIGISPVPVGLSLGWMYERPSWRLGLMADSNFGPATVDGRYSYGGTGRYFAGVSGAWLAGGRRFSPYLGAGVGKVGQLTDVDDQEAVGGRLEAGVECHRLHRVRLSVGGDYTFSRVVSWGGLHMRMAF